MATHKSGFFTLFLVLLAGAAGFVAANLLQKKPGETKSGQRWTCSMHPQVIRDSPGNCPTCGMALTPAGSSEHQGPGVVIDPVVVQNMGVRVAPVTLGPLRRTVKTFGVLMAPEPLMTDVALKVGGFVEKLHANTVGILIRKGDPLLELYSPELLVAQEELIAARRLADSLPRNASNERRVDAERLLETARRKLSLWDVGEDQVRQIEGLSQAKRTITIRSRATGVLMEKHVHEGAPVKASELLFHLEDLSRMWLDAQAYEYQIALLREGMTGRATVASFPGESFEGRVVFVAPNLDPKSRTATVRIELDNEGGRLKPGMYARVALESVGSEDAVLVPREAVIDTGTRQVAFVWLGEGKFEPRVVRVGDAGGEGTVSVLDGLSPGEQVVVSGQFLIDSESRMQEALRKLTHHGMVATRPGAGTPPPRGEGPPAPVLDVDDATRDAVDRLVGTYLRAAEALAADRFDPDSLRALQRGASDLAGKDALAEPTRALRDALAGAVAARELKAAQKRFVAVSDAVVDLVARVTPTRSIGAKLFVFNCPMAPAPGRGDWLQTTDDTKNPFYGSEMLSCGTLERVVETKAPKSGTETGPASTGPATRPAASHPSHGERR